LAIRGEWKEVEVVVGTKGACESFFLSKFGFNSFIALLCNVFVTLTHFK
jgi:hypothetical protein